MRKFYCGECIYYIGEDMNGYGICTKQDSVKNLSYLACEQFDRGKEHRHHIAVLIQANRYRRDKHVPSIYRMPNPKELGKAIDYAVEHLKRTWK